VSPFTNNKCHVDITLQIWAKSNNSPIKITMEDRKVSTKVLEVVMNPMYTLKHNWESGVSGKIGAITGVVASTTLGGTLGYGLGVGTAIGSMIFPGVGTLLGAGICVLAGVVISSVPGAIIGSEIGHKLVVSRDSDRLNDLAFDHGIVKTDDFTLDVGLDNLACGPVKQDVNTLKPIESTPPGDVPKESTIVEQTEITPQPEIAKEIPVGIKNITSDIPSEKVVSPVSTPDIISPRSQDGETKKKRKHHKKETHQ
jgi:hypothetical protein